jgi:AbrB family looped-hinge helix DNA binding protein
MEKTTLSSKYQIVIPSGIRKRMDAKPGQQFWVMYESGTIILIPKKDIRDLRGLLKGMDTTIERDEEDRI